jgi:hypothetical protein
MLISLHLPKTAGTSFATSLRSHFGNDLMLDYADMPMQVPRARRQWLALRRGWQFRTCLPCHVRCVHGHFLAAKYRVACAGRDVKFVTWLREPVQRMISHYHFWRRDYTPSATEPLRRKMVEEDWSLERFCLGPELRNLYCRYLWAFDPKRFDFIGITEQYSDDIEDFSHRYLGRPSPAEDRANTNPQRAPQGYDLDSGLRRRIEVHHARDMALYRWALARRAERRAALGMVRPVRRS